MFIIRNQYVNSAIKQFVSKTIIYNHDIYCTVSVKDRTLIEQFLNRFYFTFEKLFNNKYHAASIFINRLQLIDTIRLDNEDENIMPFKFAFDTMRDLQDKLEGSVFVATKSYGVMIVDMDFMNKSKAEAIYTLISEFVCAMSLIQVRGNEGSVYKWGVNKNGKTFDVLNKGITEFIAQLMWKDMYKNKQCPGEYKFRNEVIIAKMIIEKYYSEKQFVEDYISSGVVLEKEIKKIVDSRHRNLFNFIKSFDDKDLGNAMTHEMFVEELKDFNLNIYNTKII